MKDFKNKIAFITGGASGAGLGQAKVFAEAGCKVVIADILQNRLEEATAALKRQGANVHPIRLDVTDRAAFKRAADEAEEVFGPVELLFNTAGVAIFGPLERATYDDYDWVMDVNFNGVVNGVQTFVPRMIAHGKGGHIVNTASVGAFVSDSITGIYCASKFAVYGLSMAMRDALAKYGIGVSVLCPMNINSRIGESVKTRPPHLSRSGYRVDEREIAILNEIYSQGMDPEELATHVLAAVTKNDFYVIPYPEARASLNVVFRDVLAALPPEDADPQGVAKRNAAVARYIEARRVMDKARYG